MYISTVAVHPVTSGLDCRWLEAPTPSQCGSHARTGVTLCSPQFTTQRFSGFRSKARNWTHRPGRGDNHSSRKSQQSVCSAAGAHSAGAAATAEPSSSSRSGERDDAYQPRSPFSSDADMSRTEATLYDLLGIPRTGSLAEIKDAYRHLARRYHPDLRHTAGLSLEESTRRFLEVQEAYEILSDPQRRAVYDFEMLHGRRRGPGLNHARATWKSRQRGGADSGPLWDSPQDEAAVKAAWKQQWQRQMGGLGNRQQPKPGSWAARMREQAQQHQGQEHREEQHAHRYSSGSCSDEA